MGDSVHDISVPEDVTPALGWFHVSYDIVQGQTHHHVQEAFEYPGLRFVWSLNPVTSERKSRFFIRGKEYPSLNAAIYAWKQKHKKKRVRL